MSLTPDGVWPDVAPASSTRFIIISLPDSEDIYEENRAAFERGTYVIKAVIKSTSTTAAETAASRIRTLVEGLTTIIGYHVVSARRMSEVVISETDVDNPDAHWQHRGGVYDLMAEPV